MPALFRVPCRRAAAAGSLRAATRRARDRERVNTESSMSGWSMKARPGGSGGAHRRPRRHPVGARRGGGRKKNLLRARARRSARRRGKRAAERDIRAVQALLDLFAVAVKGMYGSLFVWLGAGITASINRGLLGQGLDLAAMAAGGDVSP